MLMFRLVEALNGCLIGPKPWDRIDIIFGTPNGAAVNRYGLFGLMDDELFNKSCIGLFEAGNGRETRVHQVNR